MKTLAYLLPLIIVTFTLTGCVLPFFSSKDPKDQGEVPKVEVAVVKTKKGTFVIEFYTESAPVAVENFKKLIEQKFYDGLTFHRIVDAPGLNIVQGGCPRGDGSGGPGWTIVDEYTNPNQRKHIRGTVAMARASLPDSSGSQFYICLKPQPHLDGQYTTFGGVIQGMDVVDLLQIGDVMTTIRLEAKSKYVKAADN